jgi:superfamily II DNA or RNA helicase
MDAKISQRGLVIKKSSISAIEYKNIKDDLLIYPRSEYGYIQPMKCFQENKEKIYLPRFYGLKFHNFKNFPTQWHEYENMNMNFTGQLRDIQVEWVQKAILQLQTIGGAFMILPCGAGKTCISLYIAQQLHVPTVILVHKEFLMNQWIDRIQQFLPDARIGKIQGKIIDVDEKDFVIAMLQTTSMKDEITSDIFQRFGLCIIDEAHHIAANVFSKALKKIATKYMIGLSATPNRTDALESVMYMYIGPIAVNVTSHQPKKIPIVKFAYAPEVKMNNNDHISKLITLLCSDAGRTSFIISQISKCLEDRNRKILLLVERLKLIDTIYNHFGDNICGKYVGSSNANKLKEAEQKVLVLGTYSMAKEGLDIPDLNTLILASPTVNITQAVGRILRKEHECCPLIIDIVDNYGVFKFQSFRRRKIYKEQKYDIVKTFQNECILDV